MCSRPAFPNIHGAPGASVISYSSDSAMKCRIVGCSRSRKVGISEPFFIFSKPSASAQSTTPPFTSWRAMKSAVDPVEQLLFTFVIGMPVSPSS